LPWSAVISASHHVGVCVVEQDEGVILLLQPAQQLRRELAGAHLGLVIVGGHLAGGWNQDAVLVGERRLESAVEEEGDVGVLLRLRGAQLRQALLGDELPEGPPRRLRRKGDRQAVAGVVLGEGHEGRGPHHAAALELAGEALGLYVRDGVGELSGAVGAEVEEDHGVAVAQRRAPLDDRRLHELVALAARVGRLHGGDGIGGGLALAVHDRAKGGGDSIPAPVAVHRVVAPDHGGHLAPDSFHVRQQVAQVPQAGTRWRVAPVEEGVHAGADTAATAVLQQRHQVVDVAVHASVGHEPHEVERRSLAPDAGQRALDGGIGLQRPARQRTGDAGHVLLDDAAGAHRHVPDLGVAHLARRQSHHLARRLDARRRKLAVRAVEEGGVGDRRGIGRAAVADSESVQHDQQHRPGHRVTLSASASSSSSLGASLQSRSRS
jgi:hypothetical protein